MKSRTAKSNCRNIAIVLRTGSVSDMVCSRQWAADKTVTNYRMGLPKALNQCLMCMKGECMAKLIYMMNTSLDGYTEDEHSGFGWTAPQDEEVHTWILAHVLVHLVTTGACSDAAVARLFTCFRRVLVSEPGGKESGAPRPTHGRRRQPSVPMRLPRPDRRLPAPKNRLCAPWSQCTARR